VHNLGVLFDADLSLKTHVNQLTACCYCCLSHIKSYRRALTRRSAVTVVNSLIVTRLDYCNNLLAGCNKQLIDKLQRILNCVARAIQRKLLRPCNIAALWPSPLAANERAVTFKLCLSMYKTMNGHASSYIKELCVPVTTVAMHSALRSAARGDLLFPHTRRQLGNRAFSDAGPNAWNSLPLNIRTALTPSTFENLLKTNLFLLSYNIQYRQLLATHVSLTL